MLVSAKEMLQKARDGKYAVGQFNINNLEWTKAILRTLFNIIYWIFGFLRMGTRAELTGYLKCF